jgi:hypothetical protein
MATSALLAAGAITGMVAAASPAPSFITPDQFVQGTRAALASSFDSADVSTFSVVAGSAGSAAIPADLTDGLAEGTFTGSYGGNLSLARSVGGQSKASAWLVPGNGSLCLVAGSATIPAGGAVCGLDQDVLAGKMEFESSTMKAPGIEFIAGLVPDGVKSVAAELYDGRSVTVPVSNNVYTADIDGEVSTISFVGPNGPIAIDDIAPDRPLGVTAPN